jgi:hypothetical protein
MKLSNELKIAWWSTITLILTGVLISRYNSILNGSDKPIDIFLLLIWTSLMLMPLFSEISLFGVKFKQEIESLKSSINGQLYNISNEIKAAVNVNANFTPTITFGDPTPDVKLPDIVDDIKNAAADLLTTYGLIDADIDQPEPDVPPDVAFLFAMRYTIEAEVRRIARTYDIVVERGAIPVSIPTLTRALVARKLIEVDLQKAIQEVYVVCSPAIYGETVTDAQVAFVRDVGPSLNAALQTIR